MNVPPWAANNYTTEQLLELALGLLDDARREQTDERMPIINNWLTNNSPLKLFVPRWQLIRLTPPLTSNSWTVGGSVVYTVAHDGGCHSLRPVYERPSQPVAHDEVWCSVRPDYESTSHAVSNFLNCCGQCRKHEQPSEN